MNIKKMIKRKLLEFVSRAIPFQAQMDVIALLAGETAACHVRELERLRILCDAEFRVSSQWGEDGIVEWLVHQLGKRYAEDYLLWLDMIINGVCAAKIEIPLAVAFKGDFGDGGLSANLLKMELGELDCYRQLYKKRLIAFPLLIAVASYSVIKFLRRIVIVILR